MSGGATATYIMAAAAVASTAVAYKQGQDQKKAAAKANAAAEENARMQEQAVAQQVQATEKQAKTAEEATNRANRKNPNTSAILSAAQQAGKGGGGNTMLTGAQGIDPDLLKLGKKTLLGG